MNLYTLDNLICKSKRPNSNLCYLLGGSSELYCAEGCDAAIAVRDMYKNFLKYQLDSDLLIHEFYKNYVKLVGVKVYQAI